LGLIGCLLFTSLDLLDGFLARRFNWISKFGTHLDPWCDTIFLLIVLIILLHLNYINWAVLALIAAHRFTRLALTLHLYFNYGGYYIPKNIKISAYIVFLFMFFVPVIADYFGKDITILISIFVTGISYIHLLISINSTIDKAKKGKLKFTRFRD
jgi:cardiolipin synthase